MSALKSWWRKLFSSESQASPEGDAEARSTTDGRTSDRRAHDRYACDVSGSCRPATFGDDNQWPARITNISQGGIGLLAKRRFENGTLLRVEIAAKAEELPETLWACVVHVQQRPESEWMLGCALARQLSESELRALLQIPKGECTLVRNEPERLVAF